jgi:hypothetical protein
MTTVNAMQLRVQEYLDERRPLGHDLGVAGSRLLAFARFADDALSQRTIDPATHRRLGTGAGHTGYADNLGPAVGDNSPFRQVLRAERPGHSNPQH